ncbi:MAG: DUF1292 domain-containing protein [Syntrophomonadaceae bacterium]|nr:DUF1292 domain-containing protein [Syntrophomonadaceae bacterium]
MDHDDIFDDEEFPILVLVDEDGEEHEFELLAELEIEDQTYRVLIPLDEAPMVSEEEVEVIILKVVYDDDGNEFLADIEDDEEWERVADAWQELADSEEI